MYKIYSYSIVRSSTDKFEDLVPYCSAAVIGEGGEKFDALIHGYYEGMDVHIGKVVYPLEKTHDKRFSYTF